MKKLLALVLAAAMVLPCCVVMAEKDNTVGGTLDGNILTITYNEGEGNIATLTVFDDGAMCGAKTARYENDCYTFELKDGDMDKDMRICFYGSEAYPVKVTVSEPEPTEAPAETPTPQPARTPYPAAYEKPIDAINAPAIVEEVATIDIDGELFYELTMWYQGREITANVRQKVAIESAPANMSDLLGKTVDYLEAGDVIHITCDLQGRIKSVEFIYRPDFADYFENGISTAGMIGSDGWSEFVFGAVCDTYPEAIDIADESGEIRCLDVNPDVFVYTVSETRKSAHTELDGTGTRLVPKAYIPEENIADGVVLWNGVYEIAYVMARISQGVVTDIIVFE